MGATDDLATLLPTVTDVTVTLDAADLGKTGNGASHVTEETIRQASPRRLSAILGRAIARVQLLHNRRGSYKQVRLYFLFVRHLGCPSAGS